VSHGASKYDMHLRSMTLTRSVEVLDIIVSTLSLIKQPVTPPLQSVKLWQLAVVEQDAVQLSTDTSGLMLTPRELPSSATSGRA